MASLAARIRNRTRAWALRRHGADVEPHTVPKRRVYILPTRLGLFFSGMLALMFLGAMNYANNLALGLTFILGAIALAAMHHCQRNLAGIEIRTAPTQPVFVGQVARVGVALQNTALAERHDLAVALTGDGAAALATVGPESRAVVHVDLPTQRRGLLRLDHLQVSTDYPFGLFRAWTHIYIPVRCIVYPQPAPRASPPPLTETDTGGAQDTQRGDEDFAGLRSFQPGDSPGRIAWKAYARGQELQVKQYSGTAVTSHVLDWDALRGMDTEARLSQLCRWIEDAHENGSAFALRIPGYDIPANIGHSHRQRCLTALALFGEAQDVRGSAA